MYQSLQSHQKSVAHAPFQRIQKEVVAGIQEVNPLVVIECPNGRVIRPAYDGGSCLPARLSFQLQEPAFHNLTIHRSEGIVYFPFPGQRDQTWPEFQRSRRNYAIHRRLSLLVTAKYRVVRVVDDNDFTKLVFPK